MNFTAEREQCERLCLLFHSATADVCNAVCSMDDYYTSDAYIQSRLYAAMYDITEFLLLVQGVEVPSRLSDRAYAVDVNGLLPGLRTEFSEIVNRGEQIPRNVLSVLAQKLDVLLDRLSKEHFALLNSGYSGVHLHAFVS